MTFQFNAKSLFATYAQANTIVADDLVAFFKSLGCREYLVGTEEHLDGGIHYHCFVTWEQPVRTKDPRFFDFKGFHPNVQNPRNRRQVIAYCGKGGVTLSNFEVEEGLEEWPDLAKISSTAEVFMDAMRRSKPRDYILAYEKLEYYCDKHFKKPKLMHVPKFDLFDIPESLDDWVSENLQSDNVRK